MKTGQAEVFASEDFAGMALPNPLITSTPGELGGEPVFAGTRVPVQALFDYLEAGDTLDRFLDHFPEVTRDHAIAVIRLASPRVRPKTEAAE